MTLRLRCMRRGGWVAFTALTIAWSPGASAVRAQASPPSPASPRAPEGTRPPPASPPTPPPPVTGSTSAEGGGSVADAPVPALADPCVADRFIALESENLAPALAAEVRTDFATELRHRGLDVCDPASAEREPAALVRVEGRDDLAIIELDDRVTHKRVARDLSLRGIPANGRALAIAIAIDELLRASWAELTLTRRRADKGVDANDEEDEADDDDDDGYVPLRRRTVSARRRAHPPTRYQLGVDLGYLHTQQSFDAFSLGARAAVRPWGLGWFELGVAGLGALPANSTLGDVMAAGFRSTLTAGVCSRQDKPAHGCAGARAGVALLSFRGLRPEMANARSDLGLVVDTSLLVQLGARLSSTLTLFGDLGVGAVLQGAKATDGLDTVLGVTGLLLSANLGLGFEL